MRAKSTCTCTIFSCSPQIAILATPGTPSKRARMVQYASMDRSITEWSGEVMPIFITRLVDDSGGIINGGAAHLGKLGVAIATRSATNWRVNNSSTPASKIATTEDSCGTDFERKVVTPGTPAKAFSSGTVMSDSTSAGDRPSAMV